MGPPGSLRSDSAGDGNVSAGRSAAGEGGMNENEEYEANLEEARLEGELSELKESLLDDTIRILDPDEPLCVSETVSVEDAVARMMAMRRAAVLVVDGVGRLAGIFTERDV